MNWLQLKKKILRSLPVSRGVAENLFDYIDELDSRVESLIEAADKVSWDNDQKIRSMEEQFNKELDVLRCDLDDLEDIARRKGEL